MPAAYQAYNIVPAYNVRPGGPALTPTYIAVATPSGAIDAKTAPANSTDGKTVKVTPKKSFGLQFSNGAKGSMSFYYNMPKMVPAWLRTSLLASGLVT